LETTSASSTQHAARRHTKNIAVFEKNASIDSFSLLLHPLSTFPDLVKLPSAPLVCNIASLIIAVAMDPHPTRTTLLDEGLRNPAPVIPIRIAKHQQLRAGVVGWVMPVLALLYCSELVIGRPTI
jgi:hypothetical protein